jgi:hypothetical protein
MNRWEPFPDEEWRVLLYELVYDDGIEYEPGSLDEPELVTLVAEIREEQSRRQS